MVSSDQPTKLSAEEVIRNYTNANFMPQKQPHDRLHLLCQSRELNPLVSLSVENDNDNLEANCSRLKAIPQTARVNSQTALVDPSSSRKNNLTNKLIKEATKSQQQKRSNQSNNTPKYIAYGGGGGNQSQIEN